jgi:hypothetical protein
VHSSSKARLQRIRNKTLKGVVEENNGKGAGRKTVFPRPLKWEIELPKQIRKWYHMEKTARRIRGNPN